jgi:hypothetical protein
MKELAGIYAIDVGAYAILPNHFHVVLRNRPDLAAKWTPTEVAARWFRLFPQSIRRWAAERANASRVETGEAAAFPADGIAHADGGRGEDGAERDDHRHSGKSDSATKPNRDELAIAIVAADVGRIAELRRRLSDLSWFMRCLKEPLARLANREDGCKGHFWEGRFTSIRLLDDHALMACLIYVDLNAIRARLAMTLEGSDFTSVQDRIHALLYYEKRMGRRDRAPQGARALFTRLEPGGEPRSLADGLWLAPIDCRTDPRGLMDVADEDYIGIVDHSGRVVRSDKPGAIPPDLAPVLERLGVDATRLTTEVQGLGRRFGSVLGGAPQCAAEAARRGTRWVVGQFDLSPQDSGAA